MAESINLGTLNVRVMVTGDKQLIAQINRINKSMVSSMAKTNKQVVGNMRQMNKGIISSLTNTREFIAKIAHYIQFSIGVQMVMGIRRAFEGMLESFKEFERAATNAATVSGHIGSSFESVREHIMDVSKALGRDTVFSANEAAKAFYNLASAGYDVAKLTKNDLLPILNYAAATQSTLEEATYAVATGLKAFNLEFKDAGRVADVFTAAIASSFLNFEKLQDAMKYVAPIAGTLNVELEETVAVLATLTDRGYQGGQAGQRLNMILTKLLNPTEKARGVLEGLGVSIADLDPETHSLVEIFQKLRSVGFGAAEASQMFRARTAAAAAVVIESVDSIARYTNELRLSQGVSESVAEYQESTLWGAFEKMGNIIKEAGLGIAENLAPALHEFTNIVKSSIVPVLKSFGDIIGWAVKNGKVLINIFKILISYLVAKRAVLWLANTALAIYVKLTGTATAMTSRFASVQAAATAATVARTSAQTGLNAALLANPVTWVAIAIGTLVTALTLLGSTIKKAKLGIEDLFGIGVGGIRNYLDDTTILIWSLNDALEQTGDSDSFVRIVNQLREVGVNIDEIYEGLTGKEVEVTGWDWASYFLFPTGAPYKKQKQMAEDMFSSISEAQMEEIKTTVISEAKKALLAAEYFNLSKSVNDLVAAVEREEQALKAVASVDITNLQELARVNTEAALATQNREDAELGVMKSIKGYLTTVREFVDYSRIWNHSEHVRESLLESNIGLLDEAVGYMEEYASVQNKIQSRTEDLNRLQEELNDITLDLSSTMAEYGMNSDEAESALNRYYSTARNVASVQAEILEMTEGLQTAQSNLSQIKEFGKEIKVWNEEKQKEVTITLEFTDAELELLNTSQKMIDMREKYIDADTEAAIAKINLQSATELLDKHLTISEGKLRDYFEMQKKIFDIESKLYELRYGEKTQLEELFSLLAEEGLMTPELAQAYGDMQAAQGKVFTLNQDYMQLLSGLTDEQQTLLETLINTTIGTDEYYDALQAVEDAGFLTPGQLQMVKEYDQALEDLESITDAFADAITPLIDSLVEIGAVAPELAAAFYDFIDNMAQAAGLAGDLDSAVLGLTETFNGLTGVTTRLARSLQDEAGETESVASVYEDLLKEMGIFNVLGGDMDSVIDHLNSLYGTSYSKLSQFSDEQLILGATLIQVGDAYGIYAKGMTAADLATELGIGSINLLTNSITDGLGAHKTMFDLINDEASAAAVLEDAFDGLTKAINLMTLAMYGNNEALFEYAAGYEFAEMVMDTFAGDVNALDAWMESQGFDWTLDMMSKWDGEDWDAFYNGLTGTQKNQFIKLVKEMGAEDVETESTWNGKDWVSFLSENEQHLKDFRQLLEDADLVIDVKIKYSGGRKPNEYDVVPVDPYEPGPRDIDPNDPPRYWGRNAKGGIATKPTFGMFGEAGAEALIPLEGHNKKYGLSILESIIPKYYGELMQQRGGVYGTSRSTTINETSNAENYNIYGNIMLPNVSRANDFGSEMKMRFRSSTR